MEREEEGLFHTSSGGRTTIYYGRRRRRLACYRDCVTNTHSEPRCSDSFARLDSDIVDYLYSKSHSRVARRGLVVRPPLLDSVA